MSTELPACVLALLRDPISLDTLTLPVLASDGYTYSLPSLQEAMAADAWHRSPVTGEILRQEVFPNSLIAALLGESPLVGVPLKVFPKHSPSPPDAFFVQFTCGMALDASDATIRREWALPSRAIELSICVRKDARTRKLVCAHPPCAAAATAAIGRLLCLFGTASAVLAPTHIATALLSYDELDAHGQTARVRITVEDAWLRAIGYSDAAAGAGER
jgi:hypothetical protein